MACRQQAGKAPGPKGFDPDLVLPQGAQPVTGEAECAVSLRWATAVAPGVIVRSGRSAVVLDLDGDGNFTGTDEYKDDRSHNDGNELTGDDTCTDGIRRQERLVSGRGSRGIGARRRPDGHGEDGKASEGSIHPGCSNWGVG